MIERKLTSSDIAKLILTDEIYTNKKSGLRWFNGDRLTSSDVTSKMFEHCYWGSFGYNSVNENIIELAIKSCDVGVIKDVHKILIYEKMIKYSNYYTFI